MNSTMSSLISTVNDYLLESSVNYITGGIIPFYYDSKKKGNIPVADIYVEEQQIDALFKTMNNKSQPDHEIRRYETILGPAIDFGHQGTTFIDFSTTEKTQTYCMHVCILPMRRTQEGILISNYNRETVCLSNDLMEDISYPEFEKVTIGIPADLKEYMDRLYSAKESGPVREYTYGNCIMSESVGYGDLEISIPTILEQARESKDILNGSLAGFKEEKACCDKVFDQIRDLYV